MKKRLPVILQRLEQGGIETSTHATSCEGDAAQAAAQAVERGYDIIIAAGGDGTLHEVVNGMSEKPHRPMLGILPVGTTNDFARALNIPKNWEQACDIINLQYTTDIDIGKVNQRYFINILGGGSMTELTYEVPSKLKTMIGQLAYYMKGLEMLPRLHPIELRIKSAEVEFHDEVMVFLVSNSHSVAGMEKLSPGAILNDGLLDVLILKKCNLAEFLRIMTLVIRGEHLGDPHVVHFQTRQLDIFSPDHVQLNLDGEYGGTLPVTVNTLKSHIRVIVDQSGKSIYKKNRFDALLKPFVHLALDSMKNEKETDPDPDPDQGQNDKSKAPKPRSTNPIWRD